MKFVQYQGNVSPHQLPLAKALAKLVGEDSFRYIYCNELTEERKRMGWTVDNLPLWCVKVEEAEEWLENADVLLAGIRCVELMTRRLKEGKKTLFMSERWFRPRLGWLRLLHPGFLAMAYKVTKLFNYPQFRYLPIGPLAIKDMIRLTQMFGVKNAEERFIPWGYYVAPSLYQGVIRTRREGEPLKVLWVGRMIRCKRIDTLLRAVALCNKKHETLEYRVMTLTLVGDGEEKTRMVALAKELGLSEHQVHFSSFVSSSEVRNIMRLHDVFVFPSDAGEGWGAVVSEALEEDMIVLGTRQCGAPSTLLPDTHLFNAGDYRTLAILLEKVVDGLIGRSGIGDWTAEKAAQKLMRKM